MEEKQGVKGLRILFALLLAAAMLAGLAGCSQNAGGTVYLSGVSRLRMELSATQEVTEVAGLNRDGTTMAEGLSWRDKTGTELMDELIPLLCEEKPPVVYVDVFSEDKDWEEQLVTDYTERYGTDGTDDTQIGESRAVPVEVRRVTDLDEVGAAALREAETESESAGEETSGAAEESESASEDGAEAEETAASEETSGEGEDTSDAAESETEAESEEDAGEESSEEAARSAGTAAARETETTAARETETAPSSETSAAPLEAETAAPAGTEAPAETEAASENGTSGEAQASAETDAFAETEAEAAEVTEPQESQENQEAAAEGVQEEASGTGIGSQSGASGQGVSGTASQGQGAQRNTEQENASLAGGEVPYGPGW